MIEIKTELTADKSHILDMINKQLKFHYENNEILPNVINVTGSRKCFLASIRSSENPGQFMGRITKGADAAHRIIGGV